MSRAAPAVAARCDERGIFITLADGREVRASLTERLLHATPEQLAQVVVEDFGTALHWESIDEDLSVAHLVGVSEDELYEAAGFKSGDGV